MKTSELRNWIIIPTLELLGLTHEDPDKHEAQIRLLLGTAAQESMMGNYVRQKGFKNYSGGAFGIYQCEITTHDSVISWLKIEKPDLLLKVLNLRFKKLSISIEEHLIGNLYYATAIARCLYLSIKEPLPAANDIDGMARYYKKYYNRGGKATPDQFCYAFIKYRC